MNSYLFVIVWGCWYLRFWLSHRVKSGFKMVEYRHERVCWTRSTRVHWLLLRGCTRFRIRRMSSRAWTASRVPSPSSDSCTRRSSWFSMSRRRFVSPRSRWSRASKLCSGVWSSLASSKIVGIACTLRECCTIAFSRIHTFPRSFPCISLRKRGF